jgi:hypothetical protein
MIKILRRFTPECSLRLGLGTMFLYSGFHMFNNPNSWTWAIPSWFRKMVEVGTGIPIESYLKMQAVSEVILALALLAWFLPRRIMRWFAALATIELAGILVLGETGIDAITFRDLGALGAALALTLILWQQETFSSNTRTVNEAEK